MDKTNEKKKFTRPKPEIIRGSINSGKQNTNKEDSIKKEQTKTQKQAEN